MDTCFRRQSALIMLGSLKCLLRTVSRPGSQKGFKVQRFDHAHWGEGENPLKGEGPQTRSLGDPSLEVSAQY